MTGEKPNYEHESGADEHIAALAPRTASVMKRDLRFLIQPNLR